MNKIIIVGHPQSAYEEVQRLLTECGMGSAHPSRRDNLMPAQISKTLLKAHGAVPIEQLQTAQQLQQIRVAPVWQGMVLDLMLANVDQALWGWADTDAVYLLDYWKEQDPQVVFVLVYDTPETVFTRAPLEQAAACEEELQRRIDAWVAYNAALLHFHLRNPGCSVLVHAGQVQASAKNTLQHISAHITAPLQLPIGLQASEASHVRAEQSGQTDTIESLTAQLQTMQGSQFKKARKRLRTQLEALQAASEAMAAQALEVPAPNHGVTASAAEMTLCAQSGVLEQDDLSNDALAQLLARQLLQSHPQATQLYEELQAAATLAQGMGAGNAVVSVQSPESSLASYPAWQSLVRQHLHLQEQTRLSRMQAEHIQRLQQQMTEDTSAAKERQLHLQTQLQQTLQTLESHQQLTQQQKQAAEEESQSLQLQLQQVRQELESSNLQARQQEQTLAELPKLKNDLKTALDKEAVFQKVGQENQMLLEQLHMVQEELESRYLQAQQQEKTLAELPKLKTDLKAAQEKATVLQAIGLEKQKLNDQLHKLQEELAKRLEQTQQQEKTLAELPKVKADLRSAQEKAGKLQQLETMANKLKADLQTAQEASRKLQPYQQQVNKLQSELKAVQDKASQLQQSEIKLKQELQTERAKAPAVDLQKENELLLTQLHKVQEELERYYIENAKYKANAKPKAYYGAADRVKQQLPYRLGAMMIKNSRSVSGLLSMPWALRSEAKRIREETAANSEKLPPIAEYKDAHEVESVQRHLSYRLGDTWVKRTQSLGGWVTLPVALYAEVKAFRKSYR